MTSWKRLTGLTVTLAAMAAAAFAGNAPRERPARPGAADREKIDTAAATWAAKAVAKELALNEEQTKKFVDAYMAEREATRKRFTEVQQSGDREKRRALVKQNQEAMQALLKASFDSDEKVKQAEAILGQRGGAGSDLERSIVDLLRAKVEDAKIEQALPVLVKYQKQMNEMRSKIEAGEVQRESARTKFEELRQATAKELAPIIGEEAAAAWQKRGAGARVAPGTQRPAREGARRSAPSERETPVAP